MMDSVCWCFDDVFGPSVLNVLLDLEPTPSKEQLVNSLQRTIRQIPLLGFRMERGAWRDQWTPAPDLNPEDLVEEIEVPGDDSGEEFEDQAYAKFMERATEGIDIGCEPPVRIMLFRRGSRGLLVYRLHHSIADGNGCLQLVRLLSENTFKDPKEEMPLPVAMNRGFYQLFRAFGLRDVPGILHDIAVETVRPWALLFSKPLWHVDTDKYEPIKLSLARLTIEGEDYQSLHDMARKHGLTINDMLSVAYLALAAELNEKLPKPSPFLHVNFTVNLRRFLPESKIQITNLSGISGLASRPGKAGSFTDAAAEVIEKIGELKRHYIGLGFITVPQLMTFLMPAPLAHLFFKKYSGFVMKQIGRYSIAMTNIGAMGPFVEPFGESLKHASFIAPIWEMGFPMITVTGYRGGLSLYISMPYRSEKDASLCQDLADRLQYYLLEWCLQ